MRTKRRLLGCYLVTTALLSIRNNPVYAQSNPSATTIRVLLVDYKTGRPLKSHKLWLWLSNKDGELTEHPVTLTGKTGKDGIAVFQFGQSPPPRMWVDLRIGDWACASTGEFATSELLQNGIGAHFAADANLCKSQPAAFPEPQPGEIIVVIRHL